MTVATPALAPPDALALIHAAPPLRALTAPDEVAPLPDDESRPGLRLLSAPCSAPPFDDELPPRRALRAVPDGLPSVAPWRPPSPVTTLRLLPTRPATPPVVGPARPAGPEDDERDRPRTPLTQLPDARPFARALVQRLLEVLAGLRPLGQLQRDTSFDLFTDLEATLPALTCTAGPRPTARDVRSVHVQTRADGVAEVCATVRRGGRSSALALRLEGVDGAWRCTVLLGL